MTCPDGATRLSDVTFCVLDLETTGTSDELDEIVEVGAVKVRGGEQLGTFQTMVRHSLSSGADHRPGIEAVLASLLEFARGTVIVGHNVRFDLRFLNAALWKSGHDVQLDPSAAIDTMHLARRLLRDDAEDCRLGTLAERFQFAERPTHRALADAAATVELLHLVIERATHYGVFDLDDLARLPTLMRHRHRSRLAAVGGVPRAPGVGRLLDRHGQVLHVVHGDDLRHRVRQLFDLDDAARPAAVALQHLHRVEWVESPHPLVQQVIALRWRGHVPRREPVAYLCRAAGGTRRLRTTGNRLAPGVVAGPLPRALAGAAVAHLAAAVDAVDAVDAFVAALAGDGTAAGHLATGALAEVLAHQRTLDAGRAHRGMIETGDACVHVDDGCVLDIETGGRSWRGLLPPVDDGHRPGVPLVPVVASEAVLIASLLRPANRQPGCEMRDSWSPQ